MVLLFLVAVFVVLVTRHEPVEEQDFGMVDDVIIEKVPLKDNDPQPPQNTKNVENFNTQAITLPQSSNTEEAPATLSVKVLDEQHNTIPGAVCELFSDDDNIHKEETSATTNYGVCHFVLSKTKNSYVYVSIANKTQTINLIGRQRTSDDLALTVTTKEGQRNGVSIKSKVLAVKVLDENLRPVSDAQCRIRRLSLHEYAPSLIKREADAQGICYFAPRSTTISAHSASLKKKGSIKHVSKGLDVENVELILNIDLPEACSDSDEGQDYFTKGSVISRPIEGGGDTQTDQCIKTFGSTETNQSSILEYYCDPDGGIAGQSYICFNGCSDGACKK